MEIQTFHILGPALFKSPVHHDPRGSFMESFHEDKVNAALGYKVDFVQDNLSHSEKAGTLRGLHMQAEPHTQGKFVRCLQGKILDIAVDARSGSQTYGQHITVNLKAGDGHALWVPRGFLHGFVTGLPDTLVHYKVDAYYSADSDTSVLWNDPDLALDWGLSSAPTLSEKDANGHKFKDLAAITRARL